MRIYDSNLLIYSFQPAYQFLQADLLQPDSYVSDISRLEVLGFTRITPPEIAYFSSLFSFVSIFPVEKLVIDEAIVLRQMRKMSLGDSIIAATAKHHNFEIHTHNTADFSWIPGLVVVDPLAI